MRLALAAFLVTLSLLVSPARPATRDAVALFRDEIVDGVTQLRWRGPKLSEETQLAAAASGVGWKPSSGGVALLHEDRKSTGYAPAEARLRGFAAAQRAGDEKAQFAFALSLVLNPDPGDAGWADAMAFLGTYDVSFDKVLIGILQAPEHLPLLPSYEYSVADVLVFRGSVRLLPMLLTMANSRDDYLRSRAIAAIGVAAYRRDRGAVPEGFLVRPRAQTLSAGQRRMVSDALQRAVSDGSARVRAAAALALGLAGDDETIPLLERLSKDPAVLRANAGGKDRATLTFPVRDQAAASLALLGREQAPVSGTYQGAELKRALRGTADVTRDLAPRRGEKTSSVRFHTGVW